MERLPGEMESYEERKAGLKQALARALNMESVLEWYKDDPMMQEAQEDVEREKERNERSASAKAHKKFLQGLLQSAGKVRSILAEIRGKRNSKRLYREAWDEIVVSRRRTGTTGVQDPITWTPEEMNRWAEEYHMDLRLDNEEELSKRIREKEDAKRARYKGKDGDKPEWETTTDEEEEFQVCVCVNGCFWIL